MQHEVMKERDRSLAVRLIREYVRTRPAATPENISRWLAERGVLVSSLYVQSVLLAIRTG